MLCPKDPVSVVLCWDSRVSDKPKEQRESHPKATCDPASVWSYFTVPALSACHAFGPFFPYMAQHSTARLTVATFRISRKKARTERGGVGN